MSFPARKNADRILALLAQGNALASKAQYLDAIKCYDKVLAAAPGNLDAINNRGNCLSLIGRFEQAIKNYNAILAARPNDMRARCNRASALKQLGRCSEALSDYDSSSKPIRTTPTPSIIAATCSPTSPAPRRQSATCGVRWH